MKKQAKTCVSAVLVLLLMMSLLCLPAQASAAEPNYDPPGNLILNPGFEATGLNPEHWQRRGLFGITSLTGEKHSGNRSLAIGCMGNGETIGFIQSVVVPTDGVYELTAYIKLYDGLGQMQGGVAFGEPFTDYTPVSYDVWQQRKAPASLKAGEIYTVSIGAKGAGTLLFDDVSLLRIGDIPPQPPTNLLHNDGFEYGLNNWTTRGNTPCAYSSTEQHRNGTGSLYMAYFSNEAMVNYIEQDYISSNIGSYTFSGYIKTEKTFTGAGVLLTLEAKDKYGIVLASATYPPVSDSGGEWKKVTTTLHAPAQTVKITAKIGGAFCTGAFYVDDTAMYFTK